MSLMSLMSCVPLMLPQLYAYNCYMHAMLKCYQYATNDLKMCGGMKKVSIKNMFKLHY
jgi:hypothetical protein